MRCSVFIATSLDGFIARENGGIDWLPDIGTEPGGGDYGYTDFIGDIDYLVMGRNTFELVTTFPDWPYGELKVIVLTHRPIDPKDTHAARVEALSGSAEEVIAQLSARGAKHLYIDGGKTIQEFLSKGLINDFTITRIPVLIGSGIRLFGPLTSDIKLRLDNRRVYDNGLDQTTYLVESNA